MQIDFLYPGYEEIEGVDIPDSNLMGVDEPVGIIETDELIALAKGFAEPIGAPPLHDAVHRKDRVLLLIDDGTRGTPLPRILPFVLQELRMGGIDQDQITILT